MVDIFLVRHGEAAASWGQAADPGLSELGREQSERVARELSARLSVQDIRLITSPMARARETAAPLAAELGLAVEVSEAFREIRAPVPLAERQNWLRQFMQQRWAEQPDSLHRWRDEAVQQLLTLDGPAVVFTHFLVINAVVGLIQGVENTLCCWPDNGSITQLSRRDEGLALVALGEQMRTVIN